MAWYLVEIVYDQQKVHEVRPRHREYLQRLAAEGIVAVAGPLGDDTGGVTLVQAESREALHDIIDNDPYYTDGAAAERSIREFKPVLGAWLPD